MRGSQYTDSYLQETSSGHLITPGTFLAGVLRGRAKTYSGKYERALVRHLQRIGCVQTKSVGGGVAWIPPATPEEVGK